MAKLSKETKAWGTRLTFKPFSTPSEKSVMEITAEVRKPEPGKKQRTEFEFNGVPIGLKLSPTELAIYIEALRLISSESNKIATKYKNA